MAYRYDIQLYNNDVVIATNDLVYSQSDDQHIADTINACPGWWKETYSEGVAILTYLKGRNIEQELARSIKIQLKADNYNARPLIGYDQYGKLTIDPNVTI